MASGSSDETAPDIEPTIAGLRRKVTDWRLNGQKVAMVPTMGALHEGHLSLVRAGFSRADRVVVSIFVNPTQFAPSEDFQSYPRTWDDDLAKLTTLGVDVVFAPDAQEMYPAGFATEVLPGGPAQGLESIQRPHFFAGVATVVTKLLLACLPDIALFGEKDYQQLQVVRHIVRDLAIPCEIVGVETVREADGLALSSRNAYLSPEERATAPKLYSAMQGVAAAIRSGASPSEALSEARRDLAASGFDVDYLELRSGETLQEPVETEPGEARLLAAARLGDTRLIDNIPV